MAWTLRVAAALAVCGSMMAATRPAQACSPPPELALFPDLGTGVMTDVPTDGVIAFRASTYGGLDDAMGLLAIEVTQDGLPVEGAIETIDLASRDDAGSEFHDIIVVWRPSAALQPSASYLATISTTDGWDPQGEPIVDELAITTAAGPAGDGLEAAFAEPELSAVPGEAGRRVCCNDEACGAPVCAAQEIADLATLTADVVAGEGPMLSQTYLRAYAGQPGALEEIAVLGIAANADGTRLQRSFAEAADEYCLQLERVSLIDGAVTQHEEQCVAHGDLELASSPNPDFVAFAEACSAAFWEDTGEPWVPGEDDSGGSESEGSDSEGGEESGEESGGQDDDEASGCACDVDGRRSIAPALVLLVVAFAAHRRTRRAREDSNLRHPA